MELRCGDVLWKRQHKTNCPLFVFFALPCCWQDAWNAIPLERHPFILKDRKRFDVCEVGMVETERRLKVKRMTTSQETRYRVGVPGYLGPMRAWTLVIEMIAKPALPIWFSKNSLTRDLQYQQDAFQIDARLALIWLLFAISNKKLLKKKENMRCASRAFVDAKQMRCIDTQKV